MPEALLGSFLAAAVRVATPLLLAALGETLAERGGVINLSIEGAMLAGALGSALGATAHGPWTGVGAAVAAGAAVGALMALISIRAGADQIISGTALSLGLIGLTGAVYREAYGPGGVGLSLPTFAVIPVPILHAVPVVGPALFEQSVLTYLAYAAVPLLWWLLFRTAWGLRLRAAGESAERAAAAGVPVRRMRAIALIIAGGFAGLAGASLVLAQLGTFAERMTAGRGFIAIAIVVLGSWNPVRVLGAALFFGAGMALQYLLQSAVLGLPYQLFLMVPYLLTLLVLAGAGRKGPAPADLGRG
jgi:simple sugar transport system permease protein